MVVMSLPPLTPELRQIILTLAKQPDIHSVSCPFNDYNLWLGLLQEQARRSQATGLQREEAFYLCGPDSGIPGMEKYDSDADAWVFDPPPTGGDIHIPYEGVTGADLFIIPAWRLIKPGAGHEPEKLSHAVGKPCNYALSHRDLGIFDSATRSMVAAGWYLYRSNRPYEDCNPFREHV